MDGGEGALEPEVRLARRVERLQRLRHQRQGAEVVGEEVERVPLQSEGEGAALGVAQALGQRPRLARQRQAALRVVGAEALVERVEGVHARRALLAVERCELGFEGIGSSDNHTVRAGNGG